MAGQPSSRNKFVFFERLETRRFLSVAPSMHPHGGFQPAAGAGTAGYSPAQIRHAYGFDQVSFGSIAADGSGQTIAVVDAYDDPALASDLHHFDQQFGLADPPSLHKINQSGGGALPAADAAWSLEISLDVEWAHAIAPKANILLVEANSNALSDLMRAVDTARHASGASVVSISWGGGEFWGQTNYDSVFTTPTGHNGVTFVAASGDMGSWFGPQWPSSSPNVLGVGGTSLSLGSTQGAYRGESGWHDSGGGVSDFERRPLYQSGLLPLEGRTAPDVAYDADPTTGFAVFDSFATTAGGAWWTVGGTSAGAPQWAGLIALADQGRAISHKPTLDGATQTLPVLYSAPSTGFHDVLRGRSSWLFAATPGYDEVTGLGTPQAQALIADLVAYGPSATGTVAVIVETPSWAKAPPPIVHGDDVDAPPPSTTPPAPDSPPQRGGTKPVSIVTGPRLLPPVATPQTPTTPAPTGTAAAAAAAPAAPTGNAGLPAVPRPSIQTTVAAREATVLTAVHSDDQHAQGVGPMAIATAPGVAAVGAVVAIPPAGAVTGAIQTATGWVRAASAMVEHAFEGSLPEGPMPGGYVAPVAYNLLRLNPAALFNDSIARIIGESATVSTAGTSPNHRRAWVVTGAVIAADAILVGYWHLDRRRKLRTAAKRRPIHLFSPGPMI